MATEAPKPAAPAAPQAPQAPKGPPKITIDGKVYEFTPGETIMKVAERAGIDAKIPRYCYHPGLPIAGTCRMCAVEVEKAPKLMTACSTPAGDGMVVHTTSEKAIRSHKGVMEFLLTNHPLDCPVCDQAGECYLQDYNYEYGPGTSRFEEEKRTWPEVTTKKISEEITLNMNRCIHCERCTRYTEAITKSNELYMENRGWHKELTSADPEGLTNDYQGCLADICPVGALTFNDFRFKKRVWFLKSSQSVCDGCSKGCNILVDHDKEQRTWRYRAQFNAKVNGHWMCDEGRKSYHTFVDDDRVAFPLVESKGGQVGLFAADWDALRSSVRDEISRAKKIAVCLGTDCTTEEAAEIMKTFSAVAGTPVTFFYFNGVNGVKTSAEDTALDHLLRRKDKTPNTRGLEKLGLKSFAGGGFDLAFVVRFGRAMPPATPMADREIAWGVWNRGELAARPTVAFIPGLGSIEKSGTFTNCDGIEQKFAAAVRHKGEGKSVTDALKIFTHRTTASTGISARTQGAVR